jgi:hypothetical protein
MELDTAILLILVALCFRCYWHLPRRVWIAWRFMRCGYSRRVAWYMAKGL